MVFHLRGFQVYYGSSVDWNSTGSTLMKLVNWILISGHKFIMGKCDNKRNICITIIQYLYTMSFELTITEFLYCIAIIQVLGFNCDVIFSKHGVKIYHHATNELLYVETLACTYNINSMTPVSTIYVYPCHPILLFYKVVCRNLHHIIDILEAALFCIQYQHRIFRHFRVGFPLDKNNHILRRSCSTYCVQNTNSVLDLRIR